MKSKLVFTCVFSLVLLVGFMLAADSGRTVPVGAATVEDTQPAVNAPTAVTNTISQYGITWTFEGEYEYGQFANGDYWILGPVEIKRIEPDAVVDYQNLGGGICTGGSAGINACTEAVSGQHPGYVARCNGEERGTGDCVASYVENGWEVNPVVAGPHGFQAGCEGGGLDASLVPSLPYTSPSSGIVSVVKTIPTGESRPCIKVAAVLTIVTETPPDNGASVFRPPYIGTDKPYYYVDDLRTDLLPSYIPVGEPPSLEYIEERFKKLRLDHKGGVVGRSLRPADAMKDYQPKNSIDLIGSALRFMLETEEDIMPALIQYIQAGIDRVYLILDGQTWPAGGGHQPAHLLPAAFTATMLDMQNVKDVLKDADFFHASRYLASQNADGVHLWGENSSETNYWNYVMYQDGGRSNQDPYGYIDGGLPGSDGLASYQTITSQSHKGEVLAAELMPILKEAWPMTDFSYAKNYADRFVKHGAWHSPDPCAPYTPDGTLEVNFGPDLDNPGMCILDEDLAYYNGPTDFACQPGRSCGRFPDKHGLGADEGQYRSTFIAAMWDAYRYAGPLKLQGAPANQGIYLAWDVNTTIPTSTTWTITYEGRPGEPSSPITDIPNARRDYTLTNLQNYELYAITITSVGATPTLSDTVQVMPTDMLVYLPLVAR